MNVQLPLQFDKPAFLEWAQHQEGRYELVDGRVVMMVGASRAHAIIVRNILVALHRQLDQQIWTVIADFGLDAGPKTLRYPDIAVDRAGGAGSDFTATAPALLIEVLSPSSQTLDLRDKASEYLQIPSLAAYLVFAQNEAKAWIWARGEKSFSGAAQTVTGIDNSVPLAALGIVVPMSEVYAGVNFK